MVRYLKSALLFSVCMCLLFGSHFELKAQDEPKARTKGASSETAAEGDVAYPLKGSIRYSNAGATRSKGPSLIQPRATPWGCRLLACRERPKPAPMACSHEGRRDARAPRPASPLQKMSNLQIPVPASAQARRPHHNREQRQPVLWCRLLACLPRATPWVSKPEACQLLAGG